MTATGPVASHAPAAPPLPLAPPTTPRVSSVDALRAFTMFTMLFVNDVAGVHGIPWWMQHYHPPTASGMTFVDLVFPAFLFLVGMSIPLAVEGRLARGEPVWKLSAHVLLRGLSLLLIGVFMVNMESIGAKQMSWTPGLWQAIAFTAVILAFLSIPVRTDTGKTILTLTRLVGFATLAWLATAYRDKSGHGMRPHWWGILGLIGWAYLVCSALYLLLRQHRAAMLLASLALLTLWVVGDHWNWLDSLPGWEYLGGTTVGSQPAITMAGVALASTFAGPNPIRQPRSRLAFATGLVLAATLLALLTHDAYGINKNNATPAWCCWAVAITTLLWIPCHALFDLTKRLPAMLTRTANHLGANVLTAYILAPLVFYYLFQLAGVHLYSDLGATPATGILRSLVHAAVILAFCGLLHRYRIGLRI